MDRSPLMVLAGNAAATGGGKVLVYGGAGQGKVIFDGRPHASTGLVCKDCHTVILEMRKKTLISMADHGAPKACLA